MRFAIAAAISLSLMSAAAAEGSPQTDAYRQALRRAEGGDLAGAKALVAGAPDRLLDKVLYWLDLIRWRGGSFESASAFIKANPDWPAQGALRLRAEEWLALNPSHATVVDWFTAYPPTSRDGRIRLANAYRALGREPDGVGLLRRVWVEDNFGAAEEKNFLTQYGALLEPKDDVARLDRLLWRNQIDAARRQMYRVDTNHRALAEARILLVTATGNAEAALAKVPPSLQHDPGLIYARLKWYRLKNRDADAHAILLKPPATLVRAELWWEERQIEIRRALALGDNATAYRLAREHRLVDGNEFAEAEWLAGWTALRTRDAKLALGHFRNLFLNARTPIVQSRSAYWAGRALEQLDQKDEAREWYGRAAAHLTTFYGQLAAARLGPIADAALPPEPTPAEAEAAAFAAREVPRVVRRLAAIGEPQRIDPFVLRLTEVAEKPEQMVLTARLAREAGRTDLAVTVARRAFRNGVTLIDSGYPLLSQVTPHAPPSNNTAEGGAPEPALVHALVRQESNFAPEAISRAGARGLMQLMPSTAKWMAGKIGMPYNEPQLTADPRYNLNLGQAYLGGVLDSFSGSYVLSLAAYNAGPGRVRQWMREFGDPRDPGVDVIDWIEQIPFNETRDYVQRVLEGLQVYRLRMMRAQAPGAAARATPAVGAGRDGVAALPPPVPLPRPELGVPSAAAGWCLIACAPAAPLSLVPAVAAEPDGNL
jgi:soluble lytic murein transglycosylase